MVVVQATKFEHLVGLYPIADRQLTLYAPDQMMCELKTDVERAEWSRRYGTALRGSLRPGESGGVLAAAELGCQAVSLGLESLDVARVHEQSMQMARTKEEVPASRRQEIAAQAECFFKAAIVPIEATHRDARTAGSQIAQLDRELRQRDEELSDTSIRVQQATTQRKAAEARTDECEVQQDTLLDEAQRVRSRLRDCLRDTMSQQEGERQMFGNGLRDEIAQALLGIDLALLTLNKGEETNTDIIEKNIANAQRLLDNATRTSSDNQQDSL